MAKILFLTDSAADIPKSLREELGIRVMPFPIAMGERELRDGEDFTPQEFYQALATNQRPRQDNAVYTGQGVCAFARY